MVASTWQRQRRRNWQKSSASQRRRLACPSSHPETGVGLDAVLAERAAAEPGVLPLLSFTLDELYRRDITTGHRRVLTYTL